MSANQYSFFQKFLSSIVCFAVRSERDQERVRHFAELKFLGYMDAMAHEKSLEIPGH
jgi:hypothetical protein